MKFFLSVLMMALLSVSVRGQATDNIVRGNQYYQQSQFELAEAQYRKALESEPGNTTAQYNLANALQKQKKYDEAARLLEKLSSTDDPRLKSSAYYNQGVAYSKLKKMEESIESYKKALRIDPNDQQTRENLEKALLELKKKQQDQQKDQKKKQDPKMSQKEAEQKLKLLQQKEKELQQRQQSKNKQQGGGGRQDW